MTKNEELTPTTSLSYSKEDIKTFANLDHIRVRSAGYIGSRDLGGILHTLWEIISNSVDELILKPEGGTIFIGVFTDIQTGNFQVLIQDTGRGIPSDSLLSATTVVGTSGKIDSKAYIASGGQFGIGAKVAAALSRRYRVISHNYAESCSASVSLADGVCVPVVLEGQEPQMISIEPWVPEHSGVTTVTELDVDQFFNSNHDFVKTGYIDLCNICRQLNIFNGNLNFQFYLYNNLLPEDFWSKDIPGALSIVSQYLTNVPHEVIYASDQVIDKAMYLFEIWHMKSTVIYHAVYEKQPTSSHDRLGFMVRMYFTKRSVNGNPQYFISVNNVELKDKTENSATTTFLKVLTERVLRYLPEENLQQFVKEEYRYPTLCLALGIRYDGAELSGITKNSFVDKIFAQQFYEELSAIFDTYNEDYWKHFVEMIKPDILTRYAQSYDAPITKSESRKIFMDLNFIGNYKECRGSDHDELYIVEGRSAGGITTTRDSQYQAVYTTRGKPVNVATSSDQLSSNRKRLLEDPIYQDLMRILNIGPNTTDMKAARFKKIIIATDADPDGYHIASLHINNLYILNPRIISSGMVWWANPPLYSMDISRDNRLFLRDEMAYQEALLNFVYRPALAVEIVLADGQVLIPDDDLEREIYYLANHMGEKFSQVSSQLNIPIPILELLARNINSIYPTVSYEALQIAFNQAFGSQALVKLQCFPKDDYIILSLGTEDYPIALGAAGSAIVTHLIADINRYHITQFNLRVTSKFRGGTLNHTPVTFLTFYEGLKNLRELFKITRYKGLGKMPDDSCYATIMNPETRSMTQITQVGDWKYNYNMLGKDTSERKRLLTETSVLSRLFTKSIR